MLQPKKPLPQLLATRRVRMWMVLEEEVLVLEEGEKL